MTRRTAARDLLLLLVAAALIAAMASLGRGPRAAACRRDGCLVIEIKQSLAWRDAQRVGAIPISHDYSLPHDPGVWTVGCKRCDAGYARNALVWRDAQRVDSV